MMVETPKRTALCFLLLLIAIIPLFSLGISNHGLWSADEPRVAEIGREMAITGNWAVPMLNQRPFLEHPPLYYGFLAMTFKVFGASDKVARIPSAVFAFLTVIIIFLLANRFLGPRVALLSGIILATGNEYYRVAHWVLVDSMLTFFVAAAVASFAIGYVAESRGRKFLWYLMFYIACTLAFYTKGFIGVIIPGLAVLSFLAFSRNLKELVKMRLWIGAIVFSVMTLPWFYALWQYGGGAEFIKVVFVQNHLQRFIPSSLAGGITALVSGHHHPFYYYVTEFPNGFLPWSILLIPVILYVFSRSRTAADDPMSKNGTRLAICWFFTGITFLSIASTKRTLYLMPVFAPISILTAAYIDSLIKKHSINRVGKAFALLFSSVMFMTGGSLILAYPYSERIYLIKINDISLVATIITSAVIIFLSIMSIRYLRHLKLARYWLSIHVSVVIALIFASVVAFPLIDRAKSFVPFCNEISSRVPAEELLYSYQPDETFRGAIPFYTGRYITELAKIDTAFLEQEKPLVIMIRDRDAELETELLSTGRLFPVVRQQMGNDRMLVLLSNRQPDSASFLNSPLASKSHLVRQANGKYTSLPGGTVHRN